MVKHVCSWGDPREREHRCCTVEGRMDGAILLPDVPVYAAYPQPKEGGGCECLLHRWALGRWAEVPARGGKRSRSWNTCLLSGPTRKP